MTEETSGRLPVTWSGFLLIALLVFQCVGCSFVSYSPEERIQKAIDKAAAAAESEMALATAEAELATARMEATQVASEKNAEAQANATAEARRSQDATAEARMRNSEATAEAKAENREKTAEGREELNEAIEDGNIDEIEEFLNDGVHPSAFSSCLSNYGSPSRRSELLGLFENDLITGLPVAWRTGVRMNSAVADYVADRHTWAEATHEICKALFIEANLGL